MTVENRIKALRTAAELVDGGFVTLRVDCRDDGWEVTPRGEHLHIDGAWSPDLGDALDELAGRLRLLLCDVRRRGEAELAAVDEAIAGLGGAP